MISVADGIKLRHEKRRILERVEEIDRLLLSIEHIDAKKILRDLRKREEAMRPKSEYIPTGTKFINKTEGVFIGNLFGEANAN